MGGKDVTNNHCMSITKLLRNLSLELLLVRICVYFHIQGSTAAPLSLAEEGSWDNSSLVQILAHPVVI